MPSLPLLASLLLLPFTLSECLVVRHHTLCFPSSPPPPPTRGARLVLATHGTVDRLDRILAQIDAFQSESVVAVAVRTEEERAVLHAWREKVEAREGKEEERAGLHGRREKVEAREGKEEERAGLHGWREKVEAREGKEEERAGLHGWRESVEAREGKEEERAGVKEERKDVQKTVKQVQGGEGRGKEKEGTGVKEVERMECRMNERGDEEEGTGMGKVEVKKTKCRMNGRGNEDEWTGAQEDEVEKTESQAYGRGDGDGRGYPTNEEERVMGVKEMECQTKVKGNNEGRAFPTKATKNVEEHVQDKSEHEHPPNLKSKIGDRVRIVEVHIAGPEYPTNSMRNAVLWLASSMYDDDTLVLLLDADAIPGTDSNKVWEQVVNSGVPVETNLFVVPAFEFESGVQQSRVNSKALLFALFQEQKTVKVMHDPRPSYAFPAPQWFTSSFGFAYPYRLMNEPYVVALLRTFLLYPFDERFVGRGFNKQSHHFELWAAGYDLFVLPDAFVMNVENPGDNLKISQNNTRHWHDYRSEIVERYGLECRASFWRMCDERGQHCDRVCVRPTLAVEFPTISIAPSSPSPAPVASLTPTPPTAWVAMWASFVRKTDAMAEDQDVIHPAIGVTREQCLVEGIDVVYTWVNGSDYRHQADRMRFIPHEAFEERISVGVRNVPKMSNHGLEFRFRDFPGKASTLRQSIRSILKHASFVRNIIVVISDNNDPPSFLNTNHPRVRVVRHSELFKKPSKCLPTFNSCAIEVTLHRIPGLSECFLYLNDDTFLVRDLSFDFYWKPDEPIPRAIFDGNLAPRALHSKDPWQEKLARVARMLRDDYPSLRHASDVFLVGHHGHFFVKTVIVNIQQATETLREEFEKTECSQWRTPTSVWLPFAYSNAYVAAYHPRVEKDTFLYHALTEHGGVKALRRTFTELEDNEDIRWLCLNDLFGRVVDEATLSELATTTERMFASEGKRGDYTVLNE